MRWCDTERVLSKVFLDASGLKTAWLGQKDPIRCNPQGRMSIRTVRGVGHDWTTYAYDAGRDALIPTINGARRITWSVSVESTGAPAGESAWVYIEDFRTNLNSAASRGTLDEYAIGVAQVGDSVTVSIDESDRKVIRTTVDVVLNTIITEMDCATPFIEKVLLTSHLYDDVGVLLPAQLTDYEVSA